MKGGAPGPGQHAAVPPGTQGTSGDGVGEPPGGGAGEPPASSSLELGGYRDEEYEWRKKNIPRQVQDEWDRVASPWRGEGKQMRVIYWDAEAEAKATGKHQRQDS